MRSREDIGKELSGSYGSRVEKATIELLLDIRDLLKSLPHKFGQPGDC